MDISTLGPDEAIELVNSLEDVSEVREVADGLYIKYSGNTGIDTLKGKVIEAIKATSDAGEESDTGSSAEEVAAAEAQAKQEADEKAALEAKVAQEAERVTAEEKQAAELAAAQAEEEIQIAPAPAKKGFSTEELLEMDANTEKDPGVRRLIIRAKGLRLHRVKITNLDPNDAALSGAIVTVVNKYLGKVSKMIPFGEAMENGYHVEEVLLNRMKSQQFAMRKEIKGTKFGVKQYKTVMANKYAIEHLEPLSADEVEAMANRQSAANAIG